MIASTYNSTYKLSDGNYVLINSLSGALDVINTDIKKVLDDIKRNKKLTLYPELEELLSFLTKRGYLFNDRDEELNKLTIIRDRMTESLANSNSGVTFNVCTTYMCNLRCPYCYQGHEIHKISHALTPAEVDKMFQAVDNILSMENERGRFENATHRMMLYGGEPLLPTTRKTVEQVVKRGIEEYGFRMYAITNGTFLHEFLDFLEPYKENWDYFQISIDGPKHIHDQRRITAGGTGTFDRIAANISLALERGFAVGLRTNVNKDNLAYVKELATFIEDQHWNTYPNFGWQVSPVTDHYGDNLPNHLPEHELLAEIYNIFGDLEEFMDKFNAKLGTDLNIRTSRIRQAIRTFDWEKVSELDSCSSVMHSLPYFKECSAREQRFYAFGAEGLIYACPEAVGKPETAVGSFFPEYNLDADKHAIWNQDITDSEQCSSCSISLFCGGGCAYANLMRNGAINKPYCNDSHQTISTYIKKNETAFLELIK
ncbi:TPA: radical SAM protein [Bacillus pacificus]|nr:MULTISPECIES: radical SAM protein [Bacillus cereus group]AFQ11720.1 radical SAM protein [Bacillus cereus FRI-35]KXX85579.1 radical SAM protein [Bacillus cereus]KXY93452.1 radical SAM protein [Bacillus cereus]MBL3794192.1 radical SAM protein [Bacillus cereus]MBL3859125.1 radical SAM protein [Bacillus cereus]